MLPTKPNDFLTSAQLSAWGSKDSKAIEAADDEALAQALLASLAEVEKVGVRENEVTEDDLIRAAIDESLKTDKKTSEKQVARNQHEYLDQQAVKTAGMKVWFEKNGFDIVRNGGGAANNCLLISILQHVTGDYGTEHAADVNHYRKKLMEWDKSIGKYDPLPSSGKTIKRLINLITREKKVERRIVIAGPGIGNDPTYHFYGKGKDYAVIFDQSGHYEAVVPRGRGRQRAATA